MLCDALPLTGPFTLTREYDLRPCSDTAIHCAAWTLLCTVQPGKPAPDACQRLLLASTTATWCCKTRWFRPRRDSTQIHISVIWNLKTERDIAARLAHPVHAGWFRILGSRELLPMSGDFDKDDFPPCVCPTLSNLDSLSLSHSLSHTVYAQLPADPQSS